MSLGTVRDTELWWARQGERPMTPSTDLLRVTRCVRHSVELTVSRSRQLLSRMEHGILMRISSML